ncbi:hypothetical protein SAMN04489708_102187 [Paracidovorax cattleyae]|uniref:DUF3108 domain-containing protein n=2 Tax=Paracidovorax cattleyae TaxID=80868 RepID=A0A1H0LGW3_9BURK|nr:hypothetical protein SAMN04489708_102187 [Paracidovorax cattleyae]
MKEPAHPGRMHAAARARRLLPGLLLATAAANAQAQYATEQQWNFTVSLDGSPIGEHRFRLGAQEGGNRQLESSARFTVKVLGIAVYRYRHEAREQWRGDCLRRIAADTDDDGERSTVRQEFAPDAPCTRSFAYWNPAILASRQLLDPQSGKLEPVQISREEDGSVTVRGQPRPATRWRIAGARSPIDVWYAADTGEWVGLDSTVRGGRKLSYRLP